VAVVGPTAFESYTRSYCPIPKIQSNFLNTNLHRNKFIELFRFYAGAEFSSETVHIFTRVMNLFLAIWDTIPPYRTFVHGFTPSHTCHATPGVPSLCCTAGTEPYT